MPKPPPFRRDQIVVASDRSRSWHHESALEVHARMRAGDPVMLAHMGEVRDSRQIGEERHGSQILLLCGDNGWQAYAPESSLRVFA